MRKITALILLISLFVSCGIFDSGINFNQGKAYHTNYFDSIPFDYVRGKIIMPVAIQGDTFNFLFDSGAPTIVSEKLQKKFSFSTIGSDTISDVYSNKSEMQVVILDSLFLGDVRFDGVPALVSGFDELPWSCFNIDGFIGSNLLRNSIIKIDINKQYFVLSDRLRKDLGYQNMCSMNMTLNHQSSPYINLTLGENIEESFLFDTGSDNFISLKTKKFDECRESLALSSLRNGFGAGSMGLFGTGRREATYKLRLDAIDFCNSTINEPILRVNNTSSKIGTKILNYGSIIMDYRNQQLFFNSVDETMTFKTLTESEFGFMPVIKDNKFQIGVVWENSLADSLGLEPGYEILQINEYDFDNSLSESFCEIFINEPLKSVDTLNITYKNSEGKRKFIQLIRK